MDPEQIYAQLAPGADPARLAAASARLGDRVPAVWRSVAAAVAETVAPGTTIGIAGGQGAGKSTLARAIVDVLPRTSCAVSLDDFYLTRAARLTLAREVHPLLATRGVPGTHDIDLARQTLDALAGTGTVRVPAFDKGTDDRAPRTTWRRIRAPVANVVFEGWCLGVVRQPEGALVRPVNDLERLEDPDARWRTFVDASIEHYQDLWRRVGLWIYLEVPDLAAVVRWRTRQERALAPGRRMSGAEIARFVAHYERLTEWMRESSPPRSHWALCLDAEQRVRKVALRTSPIEFRLRSATLP